MSPDIWTAVIGGVSLVLVALIQTERKASKTRWEENKADHNLVVTQIDNVVDKVENLGKSLGISIDRVEKGVERTEKKVDQHIRDHAKGEV